MQRHIRHLRDDERGMSLVFVAVGFMSFVAATTLAIDVGMFMTARSQAQNAADAGALAGAVALAYDSFTERGPASPAVRSAITTAVGNEVMGSPVSVESGDVTFPLGPGGENNRVQVQVHRTAERFNPIPTLMGEFFGVDTVNITATATAIASPADAATCIKPFTIPDRWIERQTPDWDPDDSFDMFDNRGRRLPNADVYVPVGQPGYTGYHPERDRGMQLVLKASNSTNVAPSFYNPWTMPGGTGSDYYRWNIANCNTAVIPIGAEMTQEPGNQTGPTAQGTNELVGRDPGAYWDTSCDCVRGSAYAKSPRIGIIPVYDPVYFEEGKQTGRNASLKIANYLGFFIEGMNGNDVVGRITPAGGLMLGSGPGPAGSFLQVIRLVQ